MMLFDLCFTFLLLSFIVCINLSSSENNEKCSDHVVVHNNQIILAKKSESNGAIFIQEQKLSSVDECLDSCCKREDCTVAIYENKGQHVCYLFNCHRPNVCSFLKHDNYVTLTKVKATEKNTTHGSKAKKPVALGGRCELDSVCDDPKAACVKSICDCQKGYIQKQGKCVKSICEKPDFQFQCNDPTRMPNCIAIYDTCNGIAQCGDGSDEKNCVATLWRGRSDQTRPAASARALPSSRVINLKASTSPRPPPPAPRRPAAKEPLLHRGRADAAPTAHRRRRPPPGSHPPKSIAESELQARLHPSVASPGEERGKSAPLQKLIDRGYKTVHLPAEEKPFRASSSSNNYWGDESGQRDWPATGNSDYYYEPYVRGGANNQRDLTDLLGERYSAPDYNQLYQGGESAGHDQQPSAQQQYLDFWARQHNQEKMENSERAGRRRNPFSGPEMSKGYMFNTNLDKEKPSTASAPESGKRREDRTHVQPPPKPKQATQESRSKKPNNGSRAQHKKAAVVIFANGTAPNADKKQQQQAPADPHAPVATAEYVTMLQQSYQQSKIAVVVLGLTLGVTAFALAFFICRVRRIKNRLRRGKALTSDEADYLINGMYL